MNLFGAIWWTFLFFIGIYEVAVGIPHNSIIYLCSLLISALSFWELYFRKDD